MNRADPLARFPRIAPKPHQTDSNRQKRRALMKVLGRRQFKKMYRKAADE